MKGFQNRDTNRVRAQRRRAKSRPLPLLNKTLKVAGCGLLAMGVVHGRNAAGFEWKDLHPQLHGYFTQGMVYTTHNNFYGRSDGRISTDFREIGLNLSIQPLPRLRIAAQGMSRWGGAGDTGSPRLDFAMADINLVSEENFRLSLRLGRIKNPYGLYGEVRDVAFTRPAAILPQPVYLDRSRRLSLSGDGVQFYGEFDVPGGIIDITAGAADLSTNDRGTRTSLLGYGAHGDLEQDRMTPGFRIKYESSDTHWRAAFGYFSLSQDYNGSPGEHAPLKRHLEIEPWIVSGQYSGEYLTLTTEYSERYSEVKADGLRMHAANSINWYVQGQIRILPKLEIVLRYDDTVADEDDPDGTRYAASNFAKAMGLPAFTRYSQDYVFGLRFDATDQLMFRAEYHHVEGTGWLSVIDNPNPRLLAKDWDMFILLGSYHF